MDAVEIRIEALRLAISLTSTYGADCGSSLSRQGQIVEVAGGFAQFLTGGAPRVEPQKAEIVTPQAPTAQTAPAQQEQPAPVAAPAAKTPDDVNKAFVAYVQKGQGRTAKTAKEIMERHGVPNFKAATPEQCAALCAEYATA